MVFPVDDNGIPESVPPRERMIARTCNSVNKIATFLALVTLFWSSDPLRGVLPIQEREKTPETGK